MDSLTYTVSSRALLRSCLCLAAGLALPMVLNAAPKKNPTSKFYVADVDGDAEIDTGDRVDDLNKKSVYNAEGTVIETKPKAANAMVFSNGTGIFFDEDTRLEVKRFEQEPFVPNRTDMETEPSISQTQAYIPRGTVGLCASKLVAGSKMTYQTPNGAVNIRSGKVVIQANNGTTTISMLQGESTVTSGNVNMGGRTLEDGQQAVIHPSVNGAPPKITIQPIPADQRSGLEGKVTMACTAKKTVYFAAVAGKATSNTTTAVMDIPNGAPGPITAFDGDSANVNNASSTPSSNSTTQTIVAVPVVPTNLPVQYTVSPAALTSPNP